MTTVAELIDRAGELVALAAAELNEADKQAIGETERRLVEIAHAGESAFRTIREIVGWPGRPPALLPADLAQPGMGMVETYYASVGGEPGDQWTVRDGYLCRIDGYRDQYGRTYSHV